jgi:CpeT/CpcT family (DUF1001)
MTRSPLLVLPLLTLLLAVAPGDARAQGQDSTLAERNLAIMAELLPGTYDNANQAYFDRRRQLPAADQHPRIRTLIERIAAPAFGAHAYLWTNRTTSEGKESVSWRIATLEAIGEDVVMRHYFGPAGEVPRERLADLRPAQLRRTEGCDYYFRRRADQFRGAQAPKACRFDWEGRPVHTDNTIELAASSLWFVDHKYLVGTGERITGVASGEPFWLERARAFHCYADVPGVGGGRDEPFERHDGIVLLDQGDSYFFRTRRGEPRELGLRLQAVTWQVLNEKNGAFNRDSLVLYAVERMADGSVREHGYAFTEPGADRIGLNLKWMLVNCATVPRNQAKPEL